MSEGIDRTSDERDGGSLDQADSPVREREVEGSILLRSAEIEAPDVRYPVCARPPDSLDFAA
jgi:hypothetical protein